MVAKCSFFFFAVTSLQTSLWTAGSCWGNVYGMSHWQRSPSALSSSTISSDTWRCPPSTSPRTHLPLLKLVCWQTNKPRCLFCLGGVCHLQMLCILSDKFHLVVFFQDLLTRHKLLSAEFLEQHYDRVSYWLFFSFIWLPSLSVVIWLDQSFYKKFLEFAFVSLHLMWKSIHFGIDLNVKWAQKKPFSHTLKYLNFFTYEFRYEYNFYKCKKHICIMILVSSWF